MAEYNDLIQEFDDVFGDMKDFKALSAEEIARHVVFYLGHLSKAAQHFEKSKPKCALNSVEVAIRFLQEIGAPTRVQAGLIEAAHTISEHERPVVWSERIEKVHRAIALKLQIESGVSEATALKKIVGNDAAAREKLKNFTKSMLRKNSRYPEEKEIYERRRAELKDYTPEEALGLVMEVCRGLRGKKV